MEKGERKPRNWKELIKIIVDVTRILIEVVKLVLKLRGYF